VTKPEGKQARLRQVNPSGTVRRVEAADIALNAPNGQGCRNRVGDTAASDHARGELTRLPARVPELPIQSAPRCHSARLDEPFRIVTGMAIQRLNGQRPNEEIDQGQASGLPCEEHPAVSFVVGR